MIVSQKTLENHKNRIECIKKMKNGIERDLAIGSFVCDLGPRTISIVAKAIGCCFRKAKSCLQKFLYSEQRSFEFRGRKRITDNFPNLKKDIESVIENYKHVDPHFKTETLFVSINPTTIINELVINYGYPEKFACYNTIKKILLEMGYVLHKIPKTEIIDKVPETDAIFENVSDVLESIDVNDKSTAVISIDDKATKKIGKLNDNGKTWLDIKALDHDTIFDYSIKPFGILDLKTNETFITCTPYSSTAEFKVDCIEKYIMYKNEEYPLKKLTIFLDNGPENSSRRKLWLKKLTNLSIKYNIVIELVYYPPYHSKYNKIERYWARLQMVWNKIIIDNLDLLVNTINKTSWKEIYSKAVLSKKKYETGIQVSDYDIETNINTHIIREQGLEKWSLVITPWAN